MIKVLIVEDDPMVAELNKRYVEQIEGFEIIDILHNGEEALKKLKSQKIDLMILDIYMPKLNGLELLEEMRKSNVMTDVILVTAAREANSIDEALKLGAVDYLIKPFDKERFQKALSNYITRYKILHNNGVFSQEDIDKITNVREDNKENEIQKGLHIKTLDRIREFISLNKDRYLTSEEIAEKTKFSRVTIRRYLEYLESVGEIKTEIEYGSVGRPSILYKYNKR